MFCRPSERSASAGDSRSPSGGGMARCARHLVPFAVLAAILTAACGGGDLSIERPVGEEEEIPATELLELEFVAGQPREYQLPFSIPGFFRPYETSIEDCPVWVSLYQDQGILAGMAPDGDRGKSFFCTYTVTEADPGFRPQRSVTYGLRLVVEVTGGAGSLSLPTPDPIELTVGTYFGEQLAEATDGVRPYTYDFTCAGGQLPSGMGFAPATGVFAGTPDTNFRDSCTYTVTDSAQPPATRSRAVEVEVTGGAGSLSLPNHVVPGNVLRLRVGERARVTFRPATGGVEPHTYELICPDPSPIGPNVPSQLPDPTDPPPPYDGLGFGPQTRVLSGTPNAVYTGPDCTYRVTDSATPPATLARSVALIIEPDRAKWRFASRSLAQQDQRLMRDGDAGWQLVDELPVAMVEGVRTQPQDTVPVYRLLDVRSPLRLDPAARMPPQLQYEHPDENACNPGDRDPNVCDPAYGRTATYRYQVLFGDTVDDTLCLHVSFRDEDASDPNDQLIASVRIHDDAYFDGTEFRCPPVPLQPASASRAVPSNPVHTALAPVHARRHVDVAHTAVRDRVRNWSRGEAHTLTAIAPALGLASLSGESGGFDYSGTSEALSAGAELGAGSWQAGAVASFVRTGLHYRAEASLADHGYLAGEHDTDILSLYPFAAWHASSGGHVWASLGAGLGELRHRDDLGFPSWSRSDVRLLSYAAGASVPVADMLTGELQAEAGIEAFALEIEGGGNISSSLPTMRGRDYRAGLAWSAPLPGSPSMSMAYKHMTGDGADGGSLEAEGSFSVAGFIDPRLSVAGSAEASFGLGDYDQNLWGLGVGLRLAPDSLRRGLGIDVDTRLQSTTQDVSTSVSIHGEAGYGLWGGPFFGMVRPYVGVSGDSRHRSVQQTFGLGLRETPSSAARIELRERPAVDRALMFTLRHRL